MGKFVIIFIIYNDVLNVNHAKTAEHKENSTPPVWNDVLLSRKGCFVIHHTGMPQEIISL